MCLGSFASVLIYRLPRSINLLVPGSHCPYCNNTLKAMHLVPIFSYVLLRGKCAFCSSKISRLYPVNEFFITAMVVIITYHAGPYSIHGWLAITLILCLYAQAVIDFKTLSLSTYLSVIIGLLGFALNYLNFFTSIIDSLFGLTLGYGSLWLINYIYKKIKGIDGIGSGDYLLLGAVGSIFGSSSLGIILLSSSIFSIGLYFFTKKIHGERIPLGTGIALSSIISLVLIILNK